MENNTLLLVDDDKIILKLLDRIFGKLYNVKTAESGEDALKLIALGLQPGVIISDQLMGGMLGTEFLATSQKYCPDSVRIILTGDNNTKEKVNLITQANAFMYLTKPFETLDIMQAIKIAFENFHTKQLNKSLSIKYQRNAKNLETTITQLKDIQGKSESEAAMILRGFAQFISQSEKYYFRPHSNDVSQIARYLCNEMNFEPKRTNKVVMASLVHNAYLVGLESKYHIFNPWELGDKEEITKVTNHFRSAFHALKAINPIKDYAILASKVYERADGQGFPDGVRGADFPIDAQIIAIANTYHNYIYRIPIESIPILKTQGSITLSKYQAMDKHKDSIAYLFKRVKWFDTELLDKFRELARRRACKALVPDEQDWKVFFSQSENLLIAPKKSSQEIWEEEQFENSKRIVEVKNEDGSVIEMIEQKLSASNLDIGMRLAQDLITDNGSVIFKSGTVIDNEILGKIKEILEDQKISGGTVITYPKGEEATHYKQ